MNCIMKKINWILPMCAFAAAFTACNEETIDLYEVEDAKIYFQDQTYTNADGSAGYSTSTKFSFMGLDPEVWKDVVFKSPVKLMGAVADHDRYCTVMVDAENTTMVEGRDYEIDLDTLRIKAGENIGNFAVRFLRSKAIRDEALKLTLRLVPNENFTVLEKYKSSNSWANTTAKDIDGSRYTFTIDEIYSLDNLPGWNRVNATKYFGEWNPTKYSYINSFFGFTNDDWGHFETGKVTAARMPFYARQLQKELLRRFNEGNPVLDDDGSYMQLGEDYQVDYPTQE